ncbi:MAG TPA: S-methyl-5-thioribose-1-phosphate isomerase, partial [archaeon]|nr:S-methyl-5-thioribose-1-phosphate isomerase [archaeon]
MRTIRWIDGVVVALDQSKLPNKLVYIKMENYRQIASAIKNMKIRGAPLIGVAAALGLALTAYYSEAKSRERLLQELRRTDEFLRSTRPTGVNLFWALNRVMEKAYQIYGDAETVKKTVICEALNIVEEDVKLNRTIGKNGERLLENGDVVLTHCNTGLGTVDYGTALGIIRAAVRSGKKIKVVVTETRPQLQGARLTTFELKHDGIPVTLITDSMIGYVLANQMIDKVLVGADRILKSGHVLNKIGTYPIAVMAKIHRVPFYVAAPSSSVDFKTNVKKVVIEQRNPIEVLTFSG